MKGKALYNYALYRIKEQDENLKKVIRAVCFAVSETFADWKSRSYISDIIASGGVAPNPAPLGRGPGMVKGAKGAGGKISGPSLDEEFLFANIMEYYKKENNVVSSTSAKV